MYAFLLLIVLIAAEAIVIRWWLIRQWLPPIFSGWAVLIYSAILAFDLFLVWLATAPFMPGGTDDLLWLPIVGVVIVVVVLLFTLFFRWIIRQDSIDPPSDQST